MLIGIVSLLGASKQRYRCWAGRQKNWRKGWVRFESSFVVLTSSHDAKPAAARLKFEGGDVVSSSLDTQVIAVIPSHREH